ncbi:hypothetical protein AAE478_010609 [Parahypoxylon ruwenzoriense]
MAPVTVFILATGKAGESLEPLYKTFQTLKAQPGNQIVRASRLHEDADQFRVFVDWDSVASHQAFRTTDVYKSFMGEIAPHIAGSATALHAELTPHPPTVLNNAEGKGKTPIAEVLFTYFAGGDADKNFAAGQKLLAGLTGAGFAGITGEAALGWTVETDIDYKGDKTRALVAIIGWQSVDAHQKARATESYGKIIAEFQASTEGLKGFDISHVTTKTI